MEMTINHEKKKRRDVAVVKEGVFIQIFVSRN
jgi:hypothetical protein